MKLMTRTALVAALTLLWVTAAMAAPKTFVVMPFAVNGPQGYGYLEKAIPSTLAARFYQQGQLEQAKAKVPAKAPASAADVQKAQSAAKADYAVWGSINIVGNDATLEVKVRDKAGKEWSKTGQSPVGNLTAAVQNTADALGREAFGQAGRASSAPAAAGGKPVVNQMNPDIVVNETGQQQVYLNPQFRYQGSGTEDGSRLRSRTLPYVMVDFVVGDFIGNGRSQIAILSDHKLYIYEWDNGKMRQLVEHTVAMANQAFTLRSIKTGGSRTPLLVVSTFGESDNRPSSYIYSFEGGKIRDFCRRSEYFLNVVRLAPTFAPTLIAQGWDSIKLFRAGVHIAEIRGDRVSLGSKLDLPSGANVFNFAWLPGGKDREGDKLMVLGADERIKVFSQKGAQMHQTMDRYSGSSVGMEHYKGMDGLGVDRRYQMPDKYYAPMRLTAVDLERRGEYVLLVNKPISTASQFFDRYRYFPQGEIHALYWDGVGLGLKWKTRRIRGSVVDVALGDINGDGVLDLVVGLNTHPGALGVGQRQCLITAYPLDVSLTNPKTAPDKSDFE